MNTFLPLRVLAMPLLCVALLSGSCSGPTMDAAYFNAAYSRQNARPDDTLVCAFRSSMDCLELSVISGTVTIPGGIARKNDQPVRRIKICGNFPSSLADDTSPGDAEVRYSVHGKLVPDAHGSLGDVPFFYVNSWRMLDDVR